MPPRFLRHAPLLFVDSPARESLEQIYGAFNSALLKLHPPLRGHLDGLTNAMIEFYHLNQVCYHLQSLVPPSLLSFLNDFGNVFPGALVSWSIPPFDTQV